MDMQGKWSTLPEEVSRVDSCLLTVEDKFEDVHTGEE